MFKDCEMTKSYAIADTFHPRFFIKEQKQKEAEDATSEHICIFRPSKFGYCQPKPRDMLIYK